MFPLLNTYGRHDEVSPKQNHLPMQVFDKTSAGSSFDPDSKSPSSGLTPLRSVPKQNSLPQSVFRRQAAIDVPTSQTRASVANPTIIFSTNNSLDSNPTSTSNATAPPATGISFKTQQRLRQEKWTKSNQQPSSLNSSLQSNGDVRSFLNRSSRKSSGFDLRDTSRRKFSIIPQVSWGRTRLPKLPFPVFPETWCCSQMIPWVQNWVAIQATSLPWSTSSLGK